MGFAKGQTALPKITSWSFSRWDVYNKCPAKARYKFIDKMKEPSSEALERGTAIHSLCEKYLREGGRIPAEIKKIELVLKDLRKRKAVPEAEFTFKADWTPTRWDDWNGAWCRVKADSIIGPIIGKTNTVEVDDFKTGGKLNTKFEMEFKEAYPLQLELYQVAGLLKFPTAEVAKASLIFTDHGKVVPAEPLERKDLAKVQAEWVKRVTPMLNDTRYAPNPSNECRWCHFRSQNGGPCQY